MKRIAKIRNYIFGIDKTVLLFSIFLFVFGVICIHSASANEAVDNYVKSIYHFSAPQLAKILIGGVFFFFITLVNTKHYNTRTTGLLWLVGVLGLNIWLISSGQTNAGATNWVRVPIIGFTFQPSEVAKVVIIVTLGAFFEKIYYNKLKQKNSSKNKFDYFNIAIAFIIAGVEMLFLIYERDFGTMGIVAFIFMMMFYAGPFSKKEKVYTTLAGVVALFIMVPVAWNYVFTDEIKSRFNYINPCSEEKRNNDGYQICNAQIAINLGGLTGVGWGESTQKYSYIPEPQTDMIFAIIAEENGFLLSSLILLFLALIITKIMLSSAKASTMRGKYISLGIGTYIMAHILVNLGCLFGLLPSTGVPLPFLSYGGTFAIMLCVALGIVQRINIETYEAKNIDINRGVKA